MKTQFTRNKYFDPEHNMTTAFGHRILGYAYDEKPDGSRGMRFHVWLPGMKTETRKRELRRVWERFRLLRDITELSWDWLPGNRPIRYDSPVGATMEDILRQAGDNLDLVEVVWLDGSRTPVDYRSRNLIAATLFQLEEGPRKALRNSIESGPVGMARAVAKLRKVSALLNGLEKDLDAARTSGANHVR